MFAATVTLISLACSPNILGQVMDRDVAGPDGVTLRQTMRTRTVELFEPGGKVVWKRRNFVLPMRPPEFSADGHTVALEGSKSFEVVIIDAKGKVKRVAVDKVLTPAELERVPRDNCGLDWLDGLRFSTATVIEVNVKQDVGAPMRLKIELAANFKTSRE